MLIKAKKVDASVVVIAGSPLQAMQDYVISLPDHALEVYWLAWEIASHSVEVFNERCFAITNMGIVPGYLSPTNFATASRGRQRQGTERNTANRGLNLFFDITKNTRMVSHLLL